MPVSEQTPVTSYTANGVTTVFSFNWLTLLAADVMVDVDGVTLSPSLYTVAGVGSESGGTVTLATAPTNGKRVVVYREAALARFTDYQTGGDLQAQTLDADFDRVWLALQEIVLGAKVSSRVVRAPVGDVLPELPSVADRANKLLSCDSAGNVVAVAPVAGTATALAADLLNSASTTRGAGMVGFGLDILYPPGTVGAKLRAMLASVTDFGAVGDGITNATTAFNAAVAYLQATSKPFVLTMPPGEFLLTDEVNFSGVTQSFAMVGSGKGRTILRSSGFGQAKKLLKGNASSNPIYITLQDFSIRGVSDTRDKKHPTAIYFPNASRLNFKYLNSAGWGNSVIVIGPGFNSDMETIELFTSGWQPLYKTVSSTAAISCTIGNAVINCNEAIFAVGDVGQTIYIQQISAGTGNPSNSCLAAVINTYTSPTQVTLDRPCFVNSTGFDRSISFDSVKGTINAASNVLNLNSACLDSDDVGRVITIQDAGTGTGNFLIATIQTVNSSTQCVLSETATTSVVGEYVWFSPPVYVGAEVSAPGSTPINDLTFSNFHVEEYRGPAIILDRGTHVNMTRLKTHGRSWSLYNNFADSRQSIIVNDTSRVTISQYEWEFGNFGLFSGYLIAVGVASVSMNQGTYAATCHGGYLYEFITASEQALLSLGSGVSDTVDWQYMAGLCRLEGSTAQRCLVSEGMSPFGVDFTSQRAKASTPPTVSSQFRSMTPVNLANNTALSIESFRAQGIVLLTVDATDLNGILWYRVDGSPGMQSAYSGANLNNSTGVLTGTTGAVSKMTISAANNGRVYVENRSGATRTVTLTFLGG